MSAADFIEGVRQVMFAGFVGFVVFLILAASFVVYDVGRFLLRGRK